MQKGVMRHMRKPFRIMYEFFYFKVIDRRINYTTSYNYFPKFYLKEINVSNG